MDLLDSNRTGRACINGACVIPNREELALLIEHRPIVLNKAIDKSLSRLVKMRKVKLRTEFLSMPGFSVYQKEGGVYIVKGRSRMFAFTKDATSVNAMKDHNKLM